MPWIRSFQRFVRIGGPDLRQHARRCQPTRPGDTRRRRFRRPTLDRTPVRFPVRFPCRPLRRHLHRNRGPSTCQTTRRPQAIRFDWRYPTPLVGLRGAAAEAQRVSVAPVVGTGVAVRSVMASDSDSLGMPDRPGLAVPASAAAAAFAVSRASDEDDRARHRPDVHHRRNRAHDDSRRAHRDIGNRERCQQVRERRKDERLVAASRNWRRRRFVIDHMEHARSEGKTDSRSRVEADLTAAGNPAAIRPSR